MKKIKTFYGEFLLYGDDPHEWNYLGWATLDSTVDELKYNLHDCNFICKDWDEDNNYGNYDKMTLAEEDYYYNKFRSDCLSRKASLPPSHNEIHGKWRTKFTPEFIEQQKKIMQDANISVQEIKQRPDGFLIKRKAREQSQTHYLDALDEIERLRTEIAAMEAELAKQDRRLGVLEFENDALITELDAIKASNEEMLTVLADYQIEVEKLKLYRDGTPVEAK